MISAKNRFHGPRSLNYVYAKGHLSRGPLFAVKAVTNPRRKSYRLAVVVSRKVSKSAVARNRMRRMVYNAVRMMQADFREPYDIVVTVFKAELLEQSLQSVQGQLKKQFKDLGIL